MLQEKIFRTCKQREQINNNTVLNEWSLTRPGGDINVYLLQSTKHHFPLSLPWQIENISILLTTILWIYVLFQQNKPVYQSVYKNLIEKYSCSFQTTVYFKIFRVLFLSCFHYTKTLNPIISKIVSCPTI